MLLISGQPLPLGGGAATGAGLRAWSLGQGLASHGIEVVYSLPVEVVNRIPNPPDVIREMAFDYHLLDKVIEKVKPTVVLLQGWPLAHLLTERSDLPLAIDLNGPFFIENLYSGVEDSNLMPFRKLRAFQKADFITCSGKVQRNYFFPWLQMAGHDLLSSSDPCPSIPVSLSPELPTPNPPDEPIFVYGGIFLPWQDPTLALRQIVRRIDQRGYGRLVIFGGPHPIYPFPTGDMPSIVQELKTHPRVEYAGLVPHDTIMARYLECSVFVELMKKNIERELAFTNRTVGALWSGLPVLYNNYSELSPLIHEYQAGWTVDPEDGAGIDRVIDEILDHPEMLRVYRQNAQRLVREQLTWDKTIAPLAEFCKAPFKRRRLTATLDQTVTPLDDRIGQLFIRLMNSKAYKKIKKLKQSWSG